MNHSLHSMLEMSVACSLFVIAATSGMWLFQTEAIVLDTTYAFSRQADRNIHATFNPLSGDGTVSGTEVLQTIGAHEVDVVVDGVLYAAGLDREAIDMSSISIGNRYRVSIQRGPQGELLQVIYSSW